MKLLIVIVAVARVTVAVSAAPPDSQNVPQSDSPENQHETGHRPGQFWNHVSMGLGEVASAPIILLMLLTYPIACGMKENGCRRNLQFNDTSLFNVTELNGNLEEVIKQVQKPEDIDVTQNDEYKPLCEAFENGNKKIVKILIDNGRNVNSQNTEEKSAELQGADERLKVILETVAEKPKSNMERDDEIV